MSALVSDQIAPHDVGEIPLGETNAPGAITEVCFPDSAVSTSQVEIPCVQCVALGDCEPA